MEEESPPEEQLLKQWWYDLTRVPVWRASLMAAVSWCWLGPRVGPGYPFPPLFIHFLIFCSFLLFPFSHSLDLFSSLTYFLLLSIPSLSTTPFPGWRSLEVIKPGFSLLRSFCVICIANLCCIMVFFVFGLV